MNSSHASRKPGKRSEMLPLPRSREGNESPYQATVRDGMPSGWEGGQVGRCKPEAGKPIHAANLQRKIPLLTPDVMSKSVTCFALYPIIPEGGKRKNEKEYLFDISQTPGLLSDYCTPLCDARRICRRGVRPKQRRKKNLKNG